MIHIVAIVLGVLLVMMLFGVVYVIHSTMKSFGMDTEEIVLAFMILLMAIFFAWFIGTIAIEILGSL